MLGMELGKSLGNGVASYFANKAIDEAMEDPSMEGKPMSARMGKLQSILAPYGELGEQIFKKKYDIEKQAYNENQAKEQQKEALGKEQRLFAQQKELQGLKNAGKAEKAANPLDEPIRQDQIEKIENVLAANPDASPEQLGLALGKAGVNPRYHAPYINARKPKNETQESQQIKPDQLRRMQEVRATPEYAEASPSRKYQMLTDNLVSKGNAKAETDIYTEEEKNKPGSEYAKLREKAVGELVNTSFQKRSEAEDLKFNLDTARKAINGEIQEPGLLAIAKNDPYGQLFFGLTPDESELQAANKKILGGTKGIFGNKPTEREIFLLLNSMLPSIGKTKEANMAGLNILEKANDLTILHSDLIDQITEGGTKYVPNIESQVNKRMKPIVDQFRDELKQANEAVNTIQKSESGKNNQGNQKRPLSEIFK
jgi:hypothetical protein